jgi:hypothetical protein
MNEYIRQLQRAINKLALGWVRIGQCAKCIKESQNIWYLLQEILTERDGAVQLTSLLIKLVLFKSKKNTFVILEVADLILLVRGDQPYWYIPFDKDSLFSMTNFYTWNWISNVLIFSIFLETVPNHLAEQKKENDIMRNDKGTLRRRIPNRIILSRVTLSIITLRIEWKWQ